MALNNRSRDLAAIIPDLMKIVRCFFRLQIQMENIIVAGMDHRPGEVVSADELKAGTQIQVENETVGILLLKHTAR